MTGDIEQVARRLLGTPNAKLSTKDELRFGKHGSVSVVIAGDRAGSWYDHEHQVGGGVTDLLERYGEQTRMRDGRIRPPAIKYAYRGEHGELLFWVRRIGTGDDKVFWQEQPGPGKDGILRDPKTGKPTMLGARMVPYRLPEIIAARKNRNGHAPRVYIVEGEKDVDRLVEKWGLVASCNPGGAGKWRDDYSPHFAGCEVVIIPDNDKAGRDHAIQVARSIAPHADNIKLVTLGGLEPKGDISDWIDAGGTQSTLDDIIDATPVYAPAAQGEGATFPSHLLTVGHWLDRDVPDPDFLLGELLSTTSRAMIVGPTGLGKTMFGLGMAAAVADGPGYFLHWRIPKARRVLYLDGEMSRRLMKKRIAEELQRRSIGRDVPLFVLSREDFPDMPPLNTDAGQQFVDLVIEAIGGVDLIIVDNIQAWTIGDQREETTWEPCLPWIRSLTRRSIGQLWIHHTGHDGSHSYGSKTREWQLDVVGMMEQVERAAADLAFGLKFTKARERNPDNRSDFEPAIITLANDQWSSETGGFESDRPKFRAKLEDYALDCLSEALAAAGAEVHHPKVSSATIGVTMDTWKRFFLQNYVGKAEPKTQEEQFSRFAGKLQAAHLIRVEKPWVWRNFD